MFDAHEGLSKWYEVSCEESDFLVDIAKQFDGVMGGRQMGGGFGGCTINIVKSDAVAGFSSYIHECYKRKFNVDADIYVTRIEDGTKVID